MKLLDARQIKQKIKRLFCGMLSSSDVLEHVIHPYIFEENPSFQVTYFGHTMFLKCD